MRPIKVRFSKDDTERLDKMKSEGNYLSRSSLVRSIVLAVLDDDEVAHRTRPQLKVVGS